MEFNCELNCGMRHWQLDRSHASFLLYLHFIWEQVRFFTIFPCVSGVLFIDISRENKCVIKTHMAYWQLDIREFLSLFLHSNVLSLILFWMRFGLLAERFFPPLCVFACYWVPHFPSYLLPSNNEYHLSLCLLSLTFNPRTRFY